MFIYLNKKGQSTLEYAVIIAVVVAALIAIQTYFKRGLQGKIRQASDDIGEQYSPGYTTSEYTTRSEVNSSETIVGATPETIAGADAPKTTSTSTQTQGRTGSETVDVFDKEYWGTGVPKGGTTP